MVFTDREVSLENQMTELGVERRRASAARAKAIGRECLTGPGRRLIRAAMGRTVEGIEAWIKDQARRRSSGRAVTYGPARALAPRIMALVALRAALDGACSGDSWQSLVHEIARRLDEERAARWLAKEHAGLWRTARRRSKSIPERAAYRLRRDVRHLMKTRGFVRWTNAERLRLGALLLELIRIHSGLLAFDKVRTGAKRYRLMVRILPEVAEWIANADAADEMLEPLYLPMLDRPGDWGQGLLGGYATPLVARKYLVKNRSRVTQALVAEADMPDVYAAVNALQSTPWEINSDVHEVAKALWESGQAVPGMERADPDPFPDKPAEGRTKEWMRARFLIRRGNLYRSSRRAEGARVLWLANRLRPEGAFYYPQSLDFRGRVYPLPQFLQPQGPDLARGLLRFHGGDWIHRDTPGFWLHGANCLGLDKLPMPERVAGIMAAEGDIRRVYADPLENRWWQRADEPWQFLAWCMEAGQLLETGRVQTRVPCYVDGTNNGLQILSLLLRDEVGGAATNCAPGPRRDVYQDVADDVTRRLREDDTDHARAWLAWFPGMRMPRAAAKRPVMTLPYGCTAFSVRQYVADWFEEEVRQGRASPWGTRHGGPVKYLADTLWASIEATLGRAIECMAWLKAVARLSLDAGVGPVWTAPSGFPVRQSYTNWEVQQVRTKFGERVRWVRSRKAGDRLNRRRHLNAIAPNFVHSLDAAVLSRVVARFVGPVSTIHDSFGTTAARIEALGAGIRAEYARAFSQDLLEDLRNQLAAGAGGRVEFPQPPERGALDPSAVIGSTYLFS